MTPDSAAITDAKGALRRRMRALRDAMPVHQRAAMSAAAHERLLALPVVRDARVIFTYVSHGGEIQTHDLIRAWLDDGRTVAAPFITGPGRMHPSAIDSFDDLAPGEYGILAPRADRPLTAPPDVVIVPGLAFTAAGDRLGSGAGFYDRFLAEQSAARAGLHAVGLCFDLQIVPTLPREPHDVAMRAVVTEHRTFGA